MLADEIHLINEHFVLRIEPLRPEFFLDSQGEFIKPVGVRLILIDAVPFVLLIWVSYVGIVDHLIWLFHFNRLNKIKFLYY